MSTGAVGGHGEVPGLTALRGIAAFLVCLMHLAGSYPQLGISAIPLVDRAWLAVELFLLMSGFIIYHIYADSFARGVSGAAWADFMVSRLARIWPLAAAAVLLAVLLHMLARGEAAIPIDGPRSLTAAVTTLLLVNGLFPQMRWNYPSWSITAEMLNYLVAPFLIAAVCSADRRTLVLIGAACLLPAALVDLVDGLLARNEGRIVLAFGPFWAMFQGPARPHLDFVFGPPIVGRCLPLFLLGAILARLLAEGQLRRLAGDRTALAAALLVLAAIQFTSSSLLPVLGFLLLLAAVASGGGQRLLEAAPLRWLGEVSFGVYMVHAPLQLALQDLLGRLGFDRGPELPPAAAWLLLLLTLALTLLTAQLAWRWIEQPARGVIRASWARRRAARSRLVLAAG